MKCKHENISIIEQAYAYIHHDKEGGNWSGGQTPGPLTGHIEINCSDCGFHAEYGYKNRPKWLREKIEEFSRIRQ